MVLAACGGGGGTGSATPTTQPTSATSAGSTPTQAGQWQTYTGSSFTIQYPQGWKTQSVQSGVAFTDAQQLNSLGVLSTPNPGGTVSATQEAEAGLVLVESIAKISNTKTVNLPATTTVGGDTWVQRGITGTVTENGVSVPGELVLLVDNHPANSPTTQAYDLYYVGPSASFSQESLVYFQPMLQSFKFTA